MHEKHRKSLAALVLLAAACVTAILAAGETKISAQLKQWQLENGFRVLFMPRHGVPFFSAVIWVDTGGVDEPAGLSGMAHLLEHMAFKGTPWFGTRDWNAERRVLVKLEQVAQELRCAKDASSRTQLESEFLYLQKEAQKYVVPNEYDRLVTLAGGQQVNATTSKDFTNYFLTLPASQLELWALLESQRLASPVWREFYKERDVVAEERRMRSEDSPEGKLYEEFVATAFKSHPYRVPTIGWMSDIQRLTATDVHEFYKRWYLPQNMVAVIVGDLDEKRVREITERYFGSLESRELALRFHSEEATQTSQRRVILNIDAQPQLLMGWHKPALPARDAAALEVLQYILTDNGRSSRLYSALVKKRNLCESVSAFTAPGEKYPNLFCIWATPRTPHTPDEVEKAVWEELEKLAREPVTTSELAMTRAKIQASLISQLEDNLHCARLLGYYYLITGDPLYVEKFLKVVEEISPAELQDVARKYFRRESVTVAVISRQPESDHSKNRRASKSSPRMPSRSLETPHEEELQ